MLVSAPGSAGVARPSGAGTNPVGWFRVSPRPRRGGSRLIDLYGPPLGLRVVSAPHPGTQRYRGIGLRDGGAVPVATIQVNIGFLKCQSKWWLAASFFYPVHAPSLRN